MPTPSQDRPLPPPVRSPENAHFFEAAGERKLLLKHCNACGKTHHFPRSICPFCHSDDTTWSEHAGGGTIYSYSAVRKIGPTPYGIAYVTLDDTGVAMMTNIVDCDLDAVHIGQRVQVVFKPCSDGTLVPMFRPLES